MVAMLSWSVYYWYSLRVSCSRLLVMIKAVMLHRSVIKVTTRKTKENNNNKICNKNYNKRNIY